jgi:hypothetical protein
MAVAIWNHRPSARELLDDRLAHEWTPTPTKLKDGERVLGYASCVVTAEHRAALEREVK